MDANENVSMSIRVYLRPFAVENSAIRDSRLSSMSTAQSSSAIKPDNGNDHRAAAIDLQARKATRPATPCASYCYPAFCLHFKRSAATTSFEAHHHPATSDGCPKKLPLNTGRTKKRIGGENSSTTNPNPIGTRVLNATRNNHGVKQNAIIPSTY